MKNKLFAKIMYPGLPGSLSGAVLGSCIAFMAAVLLFAANVIAIDISDDPMETMVKAAPANIMFVLDDSGSMDWEFMVEGADSGLFENSWRYVYDLSDNMFANELSGTDRLKWQSQWSGHNRIFYDPTVTYKPWPTLGDADTTNPQSNPMDATPTLDLTGDYTTLNSVAIKNGHYYVVDDTDEDGEYDSGETIYLVNFYPGESDVRKYFEVAGVDSVGTGGNITGTLTEVSETTLPDRVRTAIYDEDGNVTGYGSDEDDLQNFANWFSYYRRRELTAKAAVGSVIYGVEGAWIGIYSINGNCITEVLPVKVTAEESPDEIAIIDNGDNGYSESGTWSDTKASGGGGRGGGGPGGGGNINYQYENDSRRTATVGDTATWQYTFTDASDYKISVWWGDSTAFDPAAQYTVTSSDGTVSDTVTLDQTDNAGSWVELGTYSVASGVTVYVTVERVSSSGTYTAADAVQFIDVGSGTLVYQDDSGTLLDMLYNMVTSGGTALRSAFEAVGQYFDADDGSDGGIGDAPWQGEDEGAGCQQSFAILMTDGYYNGTSPNVGNQDYGEGWPYEDSYSDTLADVAMKYYNDDLHDTLADEVPTNSCDDNDAQHLVTYSVAFGVTGTLPMLDEDEDGIDDDPCFLGSNVPDGAGADWPDWPNPDNGDEEKIDDLWHAAVNGRGQFFSAGDPTELVDALEDLVENIAGRLASGGAVAVNGEEIGSDSVIYQALYNSDTWTGDVYAYAISPSGEILKDESDILWKATSGSDTADGLQGVDWDDRRIVTYNGTDAGTPFLYANLTADQKYALDSDYTTDSTNAENLVEFIRGEEISGFRSRTSKLGDVVHSAPLLFEGTVYVGANDGMLHAFDADTGYERFAYVPNLVFDNLSNLAETSFSHLFYVDMTPYAETFKVSGAYQSLLVGGLGKGGKGYYCLDISDADDIDVLSDEDDVDDMVLWEYPKAGVTDDDMGYSFSAAYLVKTNSTTYPRVVIFGNGYNSVNANSVLYVLDAFTGALVKKIDTGTGSDNGLSSPVIIDVNSDYMADYAYAGDLEGNLWKFDLTSDDYNDWDVAYYNGTTPMPLFTAIADGFVQPITSRPDVMRHPYYDSDDEDADRYDGYLVIFGTGRYLSDTDRSNTDQQTVYGIWDYGDDDDDSEYIGSISDRTTGELEKDSASSGLILVKQEVLPVDTSCGEDYRILSDYTVWDPTDTDSNDDILDLEADSDGGQNNNPADGRAAGWFFDFPNTGDEEGERVIKDVTIYSDRVIVLSFIPNSSLCSGGGDSYYYLFDAATGGRTDSVQIDTDGDGDIEDGRYTDIDGDGDVDTDDVEASDLCVDDDDGTEYTSTGQKGTGMYHNPKIVTVDQDDNVDMAYVSTSAGTIKEIEMIGQHLGFNYWRERKSD